MYDTVKLWSDPILASKEIRNDRFLSKISKFIY